MVMNIIEYTQDDQIRDLFLGKTIVSVGENSDGAEIVLSTGETVTLVPNSGCWGCSSGNFWVEDIIKVENVITGVKAVETNDTGATEFELFVYTEGIGGETPEKVFTVRGDTGNGYYGTGYVLKVSLTR